MERLNLTDETRREVLHFLLQHHKGGRLKPGATAKAMERFGGSIRAIRRIWKRAMDLQREGKPMDVTSRRKGHSERKKNTEKKIWSVYVMWNCTNVKTCEVYRAL